MTKKRQPLALAYALLVLAGCGGGGGGATGSGDTTTPPPIAEAAQTPETPVTPTTPATPVAPLTQATQATPAQVTLATAAANGSVDCEMFPASAIFNTRIDDASRFPAHANNAAWQQLVGSSTPFTANWGTTSNPSQLLDYWGLPFNVVDATSTQWPLVSFDYPATGIVFENSYPAKSDCATSADGSGVVRGCVNVPASQRRFPFPSGAVLAEGGDCGGPSGCGDRHVLVVDKGACRLWEAFYAHRIAGQWYAVATATWDLRSNDMRPDDWASADAAGLPITPLLAKAREASSGEIRHALRVTFRDAALSLQHVWPARFAAGGDNPGAIPFGSLLRLKAGFTIPDGWSPQAKAVALAAKRYGMYVADNGADFHVQGAPDSAWDAAVWQQLRSISLSDMEFVDLGAVTSDGRFSKDSMRASW